MKKAIVLGIVALFVCAPVAFADEGDFKGVTGSYEFDKPTNDWHYVTISKTSKDNVYKWKNKAGKEWNCITVVELRPGKSARYALKFQDGPYPGVEYYLVGKIGDWKKLQEFNKDGSTRSILIKKK